MQKCAKKSLLRICICRLSSSGGGAAYISEQHRNLAPVRFHKVQINAASAGAARCQLCSRPCRELFSPRGLCWLGQQAEDWHLNGWNYTSQHRDINEMSNTLQNGET